MIKSHWRRIGIVIIGLAWIMLGYSFGQLPGEDYLPLVWPTWFILTGFITIALSVKPKNDLIFKLSGAFSVTGIFSRVAAVTLKVYYGYYPTYWQVIVSLILYSLFAISMGAFWIDIVGAWHNRHKNCVLIHGD